VKKRSKRSRRITGAGIGTRPQARKRFGQHFLEPVWVAKLLAVIRPEPDELFVEIGSGTGQLTLPIAAAGAQIVAVEVDRDLAAGLRRVAPPQVQVVTGDILAQDIVGLVAGAFGSRSPRLIRVVGNLPYNLSSPILFQILRTQCTHRCFRDATLMLQREVADRVVSVPRSRAYGPMAILTRVTADATRALALPPGAFRPSPRVRSAVVTLDFRPPPVSITDPALFERMVRSLFTHRRKTLLNALAPFANAVSRFSSRELLERAGLASDRRPETLDLEELATLAGTLVAR